MEGGAKEVKEVVEEEVVVEEGKEAEEEREGAVLEYRSLVE